MVSPLTAPVTTAVSAGFHPVYFDLPSLLLLAILLELLKIPLVETTL
jgi:hypothetical protein